MDFNKLFEQVARIPQELRKPDIVRLVEDAKLDFVDAEAIVDALVSNLSGTYYEVDMGKVRDRAEALRTAIQDAADENEEMEFRNDLDMRQNDD